MLLRKQITFCSSLELFRSSICGVNLLGKRSLLTAIENKGLFTTYPNCPIFVIVFIVVLIIVIEVRAIIILLIISLDIFHPLNSALAPGGAAHDFDEDALNSDAAGVKCPWRVAFGFCASQMLLAGEPLAYVSSQLGHKSPEITLRVYSHWIPGTKRSATHALDCRPAENPQKTSTGVGR